MSGYDGYQMKNSFTREPLGFCSKVERYTTELAKKHPLVFIPSMKTIKGWRVLDWRGNYCVKCGNTLLTDGNGNYACTSCDFAERSPA